VDCSRMNSTYLRSTGTFVGHTKKALWHWASQCRSSIIECEGDKRPSKKCGV
jgi:hypothetical protein